MQIVGMDAHATGSPQEVNALLHGRSQNASGTRNAETDVVCAGHIRKLRDNPFLADAAILFVAERNTGLEAPRMWDIVEQYPNTHMLYQQYAPKSKRRDTPQERPGIFMGMCAATLFARASADPALCRLSAEEPVRRD